MIIFLHGDNQVLSRQKLTDLINQAKLAKKEIIKLNGLKIELEQIKQSLESASLFGQEKLIIIEGVFSRLQSAAKKEIVDYLKKEKITVDLIFWEKKEISGTTTRWLPKDWQYQVFKTPVIIFKFLDSLKPNGQKQTFSLLKSSIKADSSEMVFYMLARRIRELILALDLGKPGLKGAPWQIGRLISQAKNFTMEQLVSFYQQLLEIDTDIKTGRSLMPLDWHLDILISNM